MTITTHSIEQVERIVCEYLITPEQIGNGTTGNALGISTC